MATTAMPFATGTGASVLQVNDNLQQQQCEHMPTQYNTSLTRRPCLIIPNTTSYDDNDINKSSDRILLRGPKQSGKSSIAMNLACAVASDTPCYCKQKSQTQQSSCRCVAVTFFRPLKQREFSASFVDESTPDNATNNDRNSGFPLPCHQVQQRDVEREEPTTYRTMSSFDHDWDMDSLSRIQVHHVNSIREILHYLLSVTGKPPHEQPAGAIIIDDVDILASNEPNPAMAMLQTSAYNSCKMSFSFCFGAISCLFGNYFSATPYTHSVVYSITFYSGTAS